MSTTMIYRHPQNRGPGTARSPAYQLLASAIVDISLAEDYQLNRQPKEATP